MGQNVMDKAEFDAAEEAVYQAANFCLAEIKNAVDRKSLEASVSCGFDAGMRAVYENFIPTLVHNSSSSSISAIVHADQKKAQFSTNQLSQSDLSLRAKELASSVNFSPEDPCLAMREDGTGEIESWTLTAKDELFLFTSDEVMNLTEKMIHLFREYPLMRLDRLEVELGFSTQWYINTHNVKVKERDFSITWSYLGFARDGEKVSGMDYDSGFSLEPLNKEWVYLEDQIEDFCERCCESLSTVDSPAYKGDVLLTPRAVEEILWEVISYHMDARQIMDGKSSWAKHKEQLVAHKLLSIEDIPDRLDFSSACGFDHDGYPVRKRKVIEQGRLVDFAYDLYSAKKLKERPNQWAGGPFCPIVQPGSVKLVDLYGAAPELLVVDRFSGNLDPISGDFSGVAKSSQVYKSGSKVGVASETMISGNVLKMLKKIRALEDYSHLVSGTFSSPHILIGGVTVS